jgi:hypothetical protein
MVEIRDYHFAPDKLDEYRKWAETIGLPHLRTKMEIVGFWIANDIPPILDGSLAHDGGARPANVTWVIRWHDKAQRDRVWTELRSSPEWQSIVTQVPGGDGSYLRAEARFAAEL